jgi:acyl dehydratase
MRGRPLDDLTVGDTAELSRVSTAGDVAELVDSIGDHNPIHHDHEYAATTRFAKPIVPGVWTAALMSAVLGTKLPGPGSIYMGQQIEFTRPVYFGDTITARGEVIERIVDRKRVRLKTVCVNQNGEEVMVGEALLSPPKVPVAYTERKTGPVAVAN